MLLLNREDLRQCYSDYFLNDYRLRVRDPSVGDKAIYCGAEAYILHNFSNPKATSTYHARLL